MQRTTRALTLALEGRSYCADARGLLDAVEEAARAVRPDAAVRGTLRGAVPLAFARLHLMPEMARFLDDHPDLRTDRVLGQQAGRSGEGRCRSAHPDRTHDGSGADRPQDRPDGAGHRCPARPFRARAGRPVHPAVLAAHDGILYPRSATLDEWHFVGPDDAPIPVKVSARVRESAAEGMHAAVPEGRRLAVCPTWLFADEIETGARKRVLLAYEPVPLPIQAVYPGQRLVPPRVRAFADHIATEFRAGPRLSP